ncbi:hypothetical protein B0T22DRAFT_449104 [Podospora appendiculata]|uniref:Uncharacterized protein n=1 Tax=Podospora appendiculata TaxID=314037 RepID=A0AAE1CG87_9PEZI|nr:hypothetical protein B0T22DRAFT_449104 [Podospora appendiculata]
MKLAMILLCITLPFLATTLDAEHSQQCYGPHKETGETWGLPCDLDQAVSVCCDADDFCLSNGLCLTVGSSHISGSFRYHGCTDPDWPWPCRRYCDDASSNTKLVSCDGDRYCCGVGLSCCSGKSGTFSIPAFTDVRRPGASATTMASSTETTSIMTQVVQITPTTSTRTLEVTETGVESPTSTPSLVVSSPDPAGAPAETTRGGLTRDQQIAIGIGISLGVPSMIATVWLCCLRVFRGH